MRGKGAITIVALALVAAACGGQGTRPKGEGKAQAGPTEVQVQSEEYKFGGVPGTLSAGETTFALENVGQEPHEFGLVRIKSDHTVDELIQMGEAASKHIQDVGRAFARPGKSDTLDVTLKAGRYGYACFVVTKGTPHAAEGMYAGFTVT
jgi:hypothetical protein